MFFINCHLVQKVCKVYVSEPFFVGPLLSIAADCSGGSGPCVLTGTQASPWSARADENVVRVGSVAWTGVRRQQSGLWPPAPALYQHIEHETARGSNTLTHFTSKNHMIIRPVITEYGILEYTVMREGPQL